MDGPTARLQVLLRAFSKAGLLCEAAGRVSKGSARVHSRRTRNSTCSRSRSGHSKCPRAGDPSRRDRTQSRCHSPRVAASLSRIVCFVSSNPSRFTARTGTPSKSRVWLSCGSGCREDNVDICGCPLVPVRGEGVSADQQIIDSVRVERSEQGLQIFKCRRAGCLFGHGFAQWPAAPCPGQGSHPAVCSLPGGS